MPISEVCEFSILRYAQNWEFGNLGKFSLLKFLVVYKTQNPKTDWKMTQKKKNVNFIMCFEKKKMPISEVSEFLILSYT